MLSIITPRNFVFLVYETFVPHIVMLRSLWCQTIYRIVEKKDIRNTFRVKRNEREESMAAMMIIK